MQAGTMGLPSIEELDCEITDTLAMAREKSPKPYWRDEEGRHHVPKRPLSEIIIEPNKPSIF